MEYLCCVNNLQGQLNGYAYVLGLKDGATIRLCLLQISPLDEAMLSPQRLEILVNIYSIR
jgi:hypothetical protein